MRLILPGAERSLLTLALAVAVWPWAGPGRVEAAANTNPVPRLTLETAPIDREVRARTSFAPIIKRVGPSVVNIYTTTVLRERQGLNPFFNDPILRHFFGDPGSMQPRERRSQNLGSGVIVSADGYILTASHVVEGADEVKVSLASGEEEFTAKVIGTDPPTDIAVLKVTSKAKLPAITIGDSDQLEVGDFVLALGNPFGVGQTVTSGLVSALGRGGFGITGYEDFIQTDAAINPGNSGGALVDAQGRLMGVNTAIISASGGFNGVGFAVPVNMARFVMERLVSEGKVRRGYLGISIQPLTPDLAKEFSLPDESAGVLVGGFAEGSSAAKAGVKEGDVILEVDGKKVTSPRALQLVVAKNLPGSKINLRLLRSERAGRKAVEKTVAVTLGELPQDEVFGGRSSRERRGQEDTGGYDALDGVEVADLDARTRRQAGLPANLRGALVNSVAPGSNAARAGVTPGDVIVEINRVPVEDAEKAVELSNKATGDTILLRIYSTAGNRTGSTRYVVVDNKKK